MIEVTPGTPDGPCCWPWPCAWPARPARGRSRLAADARPERAPPLRSAVSATIADCTPGIALTASSARFRTGSQACTTAGIHGDREEHLAVARDDVGQRAGLRQRRAVGRGDLAQRCKHIVLGDRHVTSFLRRFGVTIVVPALWSTPRPQDIDRAKQHSANLEETMAKVAFLGLGVMGYPMAGHLKNKGGHEVTVYNRNAAKADKWVAQYGGKKAATPKEAATGQDFVMMCVGNDNDVREVDARRQRRVRRREQGRGVRRSHHRLRRGRAPASRRGEEARLRLRRCAGVRRPGRRRERRAHRDVRRRCRRLTAAPSR